MYLLPNGLEKHELVLDFGKMASFHEQISL